MKYFVARVRIPEKGFFVKIMYCISMQVERCWLAWAWWYLTYMQDSADIQNKKMSFEKSRIRTQATLLPKGRRRNHYPTHVTLPPVTCRWNYTTVRMRYNISGGVWLQVHSNSVCVLFTRESELKQGICPCTEAVVLLEINWKVASFLSHMCKTSFSKWSQGPSQLQLAAMLAYKIIFMGFEPRHKIAMQPPC